MDDEEDEFPLPAAGIGQDFAFDKEEVIIYYTSTPSFFLISSMSSCVTYSSPQYLQTELSRTLSDVDDLAGTFSKVS